MAELAKEQHHGVMGKFKVGERVQVKNYNSHGKWNLGQVEAKVCCNLHNYFKLDSHLDKALSTDASLKSLITGVYL